MDGSINRMFGFVFGATYVVVGLVGFAVTGGVDFAASEGKDLIVFGVNPLHNLIHIAVGALLLGGAAGGVRSARSVNGIVGATYLLVAAVGFIILDSSANILALNHPDNILHLISAMAALGVAIKADRAVTLSPGRHNGASVVGIPNRRRGDSERTPRPMGGESPASILEGRTHHDREA